MSANTTHIEFTVNGKAYALDVAVNARLLDVLRDDLRLIGTKEGCGIGECGACTVVIGTEAVNSCLILAPQADGMDILTVEGLATDGELAPLQQAFLDEGAVQCGFCTPGMLMSAHALVEANPDADEGAIKEAIAGNLCRCTGYKQNVAAIKRVLAEG